MIDDNLIEQLKAFIRQRYELVEEPVQKKRPGLASRKNTGRMIPGAKTYMRGNSFENLADTLSGFIRKKRNSETFSTLLEQLRIVKGMTPAQLYNGAWVKKQLYSKIMGERNYHPSKNTVIAFGMSLRLEKEDMDGLLESSGYTFSSSSIADLVILFCLEQGLYNLHDVNALLISVDQKVLCRE